jgi:GTPase Era involved in 16S rRNA processing
MRLGSGVQERPKNQVKVRRVKKVASEKPVVNGENGNQIRWIGPEKKVDITVNFA